MKFPKMWRGSKAAWNFSKNSSDWVAGPLTFYPCATARDPLRQILGPKIVKFSFQCFSRAAVKCDLLKRVRILSQRVGPSLPGRVGTPTSTTRKIALRLLRYYFSGAE